MQETVDKLLRDLAAQLGTTVDKLWGVMVQGQFGVALTDLIIAVPLLVITIVGARAFYRNWIGFQRDQDDQQITGCVLSAIATGVGTITTLILLHDAIPRLVSPEYVALMKIAELFK